MNGKKQIINFNMKGNIYIIFNKNKLPKFLNIKVKKK